VTLIAQRRLYIALEGAFGAIERIGLHRAYHGYGVLGMRVRQYAEGMSLDIIIHE